MDRVDIILSVYNGMPYLPELLQSIREQTYSDWRLWVRDDGSTDDSVAVLQRTAARDPRIQLLSSGQQRLGASRSYGWLLQQSQLENRYTMFCDADDYWLPEKVEQSVGKIREIERAGHPNEPLLVHTDLLVANERLEVIASSYWDFMGLTVEPSTLKRIVYQNVVTGPTMIINRPLREVVTPIPSEAVYQDWWVALVAAALGRIVALPEATVLYRQHQRNSVGAQRAPWLQTLVGKLGRHSKAAAAAREELRRATAQAGALLNQYHDQISPADRSVLQRFSELLTSGPVRRRWRMFDLARSPDQSLLRALGRALRA